MGIKASIIIPVYNVEKYLKECLDSISLQTYSDWECILVDDGSKDSSGAICDSYAERDSRFVVIHKQNEGVSCARNSGLDIAKGEWILFVDSDDYLQKQYVEDLMLCTKYNVDFIFTGYTKFQDAKIINEVKFQSGCYSGEKKAEIITVLSNVGTPWAKAYNHKILNKEGIRFDKNLSVSEDRLFMYTYLYYVKSIYVLDRSDYYYRISPTSISFTKRKPQEYIYRFDALAEKASMLLNKWNLPLNVFYPFLDIHLQMEKDIVKRLGLSYLLENSKIAKLKDIYGIKKAPIIDRLRIYYKMGIYMYLLYNNKWKLLSRVEKVKTK